MVSSQKILVAKVIIVKCIIDNSKTKSQVCLKGYISYYLVLVLTLSESACAWSKDAPNWNPLASIRITVKRLLNLSNVQL